MTGGLGKLGRWVVKELESHYEVLVVLITIISLRGVGSVNCYRYKVLIALIVFDARC